MKNSENTTFTYGIAQGLMRHLATTRSLYSLSLQGVIFDDKGYKKITHGLQMNKTIKILSITKAFFLPDSFAALMDSIACHSSIESLDLSYNALTDFHGKHLIHIITKQSNKRNESIWMKGLRGNNVDNKEITGLTQINLSNNRLSDTFIRSASHYIQIDEYLRVVNLSSNIVEKDGCTLIASSLKSNKCLINFDLRNNPGFGEVHLKEISFVLARNLKSSCKSYEVIS